MSKQAVQNKVVIYQAKNGAIELRGDATHETIWATQAQIAEVFGVERSVVTKHIKNIYKEQELSQDRTCAKIAQVQTEGGRSVERTVEHYNLDLIISVGYRVNSKTATQFRQWATSTLRCTYHQGLYHQPQAGCQKLRRLPQISRRHPGTSPRTCHPRPKGRPRSHQGIRDHLGIARCLRP